jgi:hypothetical protein
MALTRAVRMGRLYRGAALVALGATAATLLAAAPLAAAPTPVTPTPDRVGEVPPGGPQRATREELQARIAALEAQVAGGKKGASRARADLAATRLRLERGDFRVGDRFVLTYRLEKVGVDTVNVRDSLTIKVGAMPDLHLSGVLRAELESHLDRHVAKYMRSYELRASILTRVAVFGAVGRPGYLYVPPDRPISDLLMAAGGPSPSARLEQLELRRNGTVLLDGKALRRAINEGRTLEELDVQSGDELSVPDRRRMNYFTLVQSAVFTMSIILGSLQFLSWYYSQQR